MTANELAWLAGLLEGEGSFIINKKKGHSKNHYCVKLVMTDLDVMNKAAKLLNSKISKPFLRPNRLPQYSITVYNQAAIELMHLLFPLMGNRRQQKITEIFNDFKIRGPFRKYKKEYL